MDNQKKVVRQAARTPLTQEAHLRGGEEGNASSSVQVPQGMSFGSVVAWLRQNRQLTQQELATRLGISVSMVSLLESDSRRATRNLLLKFDEALHLTHDERNTLANAAGFPVDALADAILRVVEVLSDEVNIGPMNRRLILADLAASAMGWRDLMQGASLVHRGDLRQAKQHFADLANHAEYTPTLRSCVAMEVANIEEKLGELDSAGTHIQDAERSLQPLPSDWAPMLQADVYAVQGMVALRRGRYPTAATLMERGRSIYRRLPRTAANQDTIDMGLGESYKRLALLHLMRDLPVEALELCDKAETYLSTVNTASARKALLGLNEFRAWAYSLLGRFGEANHLYTTSQGERRRIGDKYGVVKVSLYSADNYLRELESILKAKRIDEEPNPTQRAKALRDTLMPYSHQIEKAKHAYEQALGGMEEIGEWILRGRCLLGLGETLRLRAILSGNTEDSMNAQQRLEEALALETEIGQGRRIPMVYESLARLEWDQLRIQSAIHYFALCLEEISKPGVIYSQDEAGDRVRNRVERIVEILRRTDERGGTRPRVLVKTVGGSDIASDWRGASAQLLEITRDFLSSSEPELIAKWDLDPGWIQQLRLLEQEEGPCILAQNHLSLALSSGQPPNLPYRATDDYRERCRLFLSNVKQANRQGSNGGYRELCCRNVVEADLQQSSIQEWIQGQIITAGDLATKLPDGFRLASGAYELPFGFAIKGRIVLLEVPADLAPQLVEGSRKESAREKTWCYRVDVTTQQANDFAQSLNAIFDELWKIAERPIKFRDSTIEWLTKAAHRQYSFLVAGAGGRGF